MATYTVCSLCGDVGFSDKLFQCTRCVSRFQHSYCSNYYKEAATETNSSICDWCLSEEHNSHTRHGPSPKKHADQKPKRSGDQEDSKSGGKGSSSSTPSKPGGRRYKLLKDVLC